jgi:hypothetical protein
LIAAIFITAIIVILIINGKSFDPKLIQLEEATREHSDLTELSKNHTFRDFNRYVCKDPRRIGGEERYVKQAPDTSIRVEGAWYACFDESLNPATNPCLVYSFGINTDESFDLEINQKYGCHVHSFDPFIEAVRFKQIRDADPKLNQAFEIRVNDKWSFYRLGLLGPHSNLKIPQELRIGSILNFDQILELTGNRNKVVDIFKMDIEESDVSVLEHIDVDYLCKYVKQFMLETHPYKMSPAKARLLLNKLEKCFLLFRRDAKFYHVFNFGPTGLLTEFQSKASISLAGFPTEMDLAQFIFTIGELYFVNVNFLNK